MKFTIRGRLLGANEYINLLNRNRYRANQAKQELQGVIKYYIGNKTIESKPPYRINITWYEENHRRDVDNVCFGIKFILDALVSRGVIPDDRQKIIKEVNHKVLVDKINPRVEVEIESINREK